MWGFPSLPRPNQVVDGNGIKSKFVSAIVSTYVFGIVSPVNGKTWKLNRFKGEKPN